MNAIGQLSENIFLRNLSNKFQRLPAQLNQFLESDAELLRLDDGTVLAITTDSIVEEINTGLYSDPAHIGWMTVVVNLSDLAAVGAEPLGILTTQNIPPGYPDAQLDALQSGIAEACEVFGVFVLGGDTNRAETLQTGGTALGLLKDGPIITRKGAQPGDLLYVSGGMGIGNAYAFQVLLERRGTIDYRPMARLKEGQLVRQFGSCCIDTSDGFFPALCNLLEINAIGFTLNKPFHEFAHPAVTEIANDKQIPAWFFLAGPHGEFELLFTIPPQKEFLFLQQAESLHWLPLKIGVVTPAKTCILQTPEATWSLEPHQIANLFTETGEDPQTFLSALFKKQSLWKLP